MTDTTNTVEPKSPEREAAELRKLEVETEGLKLDAAIKLVDLREKEAKAVFAEQDAVIKGISRKERERVEEVTSAADYYHFHHFFDGPVHEKTVFAALNTLNTWHRLYPNSDWEITINSPGGSVTEGMHLFDQITSYSRRGGGGHHITMTVRGYAASMAGILLQAADVRRVGPESYIMIHEVSTFAQGKIGELQDEIKFLERISERVADIFVKRSAEAAKQNRKVKGISLKEFQAGWRRTDWWVDSAEALRLGFVDAIG